MGISEIKTPTTHMVVGNRNEKKKRKSMQGLKTIIYRTWIG